jgi:protein-disulfide isomerase
LFLFCKANSYQVKIYDEFLIKTLTTNNMIRNLFHLILAATFITLVGLFVYKKIKNPEILTAAVRNSEAEAKTKETFLKSDKSFSKDEIEAIVRNYIINNPDILVSSLENMHKQKTQDTAKKANEYLENNRSEIETIDNPPILGNKEGDISIVVFYDYNCTYCKKANLETNKIISSDPGVKIILRPIAILGGTSLYAAKTSLALQKIAPNNFAAMHDELMQMQIINEESVKNLMDKYKIDYSILENEINSYATKQLITKNFELARSLGISGAPSFIINGIFIPGFIPEDKLKQIIIQIRATEEKPNEKSAESEKDKE